VIAFAIDTLEHVWTGFALFYLKPQQVEFEIGLTALCKLFVVFSFVQSIVLHAFGPLCSAQKGQITPLPAILALWDSMIHVHALNCCDMIPYIKTPVD